jgi:Asp-tRNA(Asn)/Glu-tRNA(Gln) amidotransferase A subunit family amidase
MIVTTQEDYFWTYWTTDLQEWAREYKVEREETSYEDSQGVTHIVPWIAKVKKVIIWTDEDNSYELQELSDLEEDYGIKWWKLKDNHIFLNFTPEETIEWGLEIQWIQAINELTDLAANIEDVVFPWHSDLKQFTKVLLVGLKAELWDHKQDFNKSDSTKYTNWARNKYNDELEKMKRYISQRVQSIYYSDVQK